MSQIVYPVPQPPPFVARSPQIIIVIPADPAPPPPSSPPPQLLWTVRQPDQITVRRPAVGFLPTPADLQPPQLLQRGTAQDLPFVLGLPHWFQGFGVPPPPPPPPPPSTAAAGWERLGSNAYDISAPIYRYHLVDGNPTPPLILAPRDDRTVQLFPGAGAGFSGQSISVQGTNEVSSPVGWQTLNDSRGTGNPATLSAAGSLMLMEITYQIRLVPSGAVDVWAYVLTSE